MNRRLNSKIILVTIAATFITVSIAYAQPPDKRGWQEKKARREAFRKELAEKLNLSPEQQTLLDANRSEHRQKMQEIFKNIREKRSELREELEKPTLDMEKIKGKHAELKTLFSSMLDLRLDGILKTSKILSPEQRKIMSEFLKEKRKNSQHFGDKERMDVPPPPFDDMEGIDVPLPPLGEMKGMCIPPPPFVVKKRMYILPPPFGEVEGMDDIEFPH